MLNVTDLASEKLVEYMQVNNISSSLRVFMSQGGCAGPALVLALDEMKKEDQIFNQGGLVFLVDSSLLDMCGTITVDYITAASQSGFSVRSTNPLPGGGGGCNSGSCGSEGCGC